MNFSLAQSLECASFLYSRYIVTYITGGVIVKEYVLDAKKAVVEEIVGKLNDSASAVVVEYRGLTVAEVTELRRLLRAEEIEFKVYKNTMVSRACDEANMAELKAVLTGPNAIAFGKDAVAPARVLANFAKDHKALVLKGGMIDGAYADQELVQKFSKLPNKEGLLSQLVGMLQSPVVKFACAVKAVAEAKAEGTEAPAAEAAEEAAE